MAWWEGYDPAYVKAYRRAYYLKHKELENTRRTLYNRDHRYRQTEYLKSKGLWPIIPEERLYEVPPNLRELILIKEFKRALRSSRSPKEVLYQDGESEREGD